MMAAAFTSGTGLLASERLDDGSPGWHGLVVGLQSTLLLLTLILIVLCVTTFWFNRPRFLVPARYRDAIGRLEERRRERSSR